LAVSTTRVLRPGAIAPYLGVAKPKGILPHLITAAAGAVLAAQGSPEPSRLSLTLVGGACLAGAANAFNSYLDRDIDALMARTSRRPLPSGRISPERTLIFGVGLGMLGVSILSLFVNWQAATLAVVALFYYAAYTLFLKRRSFWAAVIGSGVGAMPPLIGWVSVTRRVEITPIILSVIIVMWTLPHFWSLATFRRRDFERAGLKVMPARGAAWWMIASSCLLVPTSLVLAPVARLSSFYLAVASLLGGGLLGLAMTMVRREPERNALRLYRYSIPYIAVLFAAIIIGKLVS
jgi:protoheme IX farnesyltransferase